MLFVLLEFLKKVVFLIFVALPKGRAFRSNLFWKKKPKKDFRCNP
jgi:hypothetical protein